MEKDVIDSSKIIYRKYLAVKQYFNGNFDYFKYNGLTAKKMADNLETKKEFWVCAKLYKKYKLEEIERLFVVNAFNNDKFWLGDINYQLYIDFEKYIQSNLYVFKDEIKPLFRDYKYNERFNSSERFKYSEVYMMYKAKLLSPETLLILNMTTKMLDKVYNKHNDFIFESEYLKLKKYQTFLEEWNFFDKSVVGKKIKEKILEIS